MKLLKIEKETCHKETCHDATKCYSKNGKINYGLPSICYFTKRRNHWVDQKITV